MRNFLIAYLRVLAKGVIKVRKPDIIAVTGSAGKTTTKEMIYTVLSSVKGVFVARSSGNLNTEIGVPLAVLGFKNQPTKFSWPFVVVGAFFRFLFYAISVIPYPKILILEFAADKPDDIEYLTNFIKPRISVITNIGPTHLEKFKTIENVAQEKAKILFPLGKNDYAILNFNDERVKELAPKTKAKVVWFKEGSGNSGGAGRAIGRLYGMSFDQIDEALKKFKSLPGRGKFTRTKTGLNIIDETYNANPLSVNWALKKLEKYQGRKVVILGEMRELGAKSKDFHQEIARQARLVADVLVLVGKEFKDSKTDYYFDDSSSCARSIHAIVKKDDIILIKGSRSVKMEVVYENLLH